MKIADFSAKWATRSAQNCRVATNLRRRGELGVASELEYSGGQGLAIHDEVDLEEELPVHVAVQLSRGEGDEGSPVALSVQTPPDFVYVDREVERVLVVVSELEELLLADEVTSQIMEALRGRHVTRLLLQLQPFALGEVADQLVMLGLQVASLAGQVAVDAEGVLMQTRRVTTRTKPYNGMRFTDLALSPPVKHEFVISQESKLVIDAPLSLQVHRDSYKFTPELLLSSWSRVYPAELPRGVPSSDYWRTEIILGPLDDRERLRKLRDFFFSCFVECDAIVKGLR